MHGPSRERTSVCVCARFIAPSHDYNVRYNCKHMWAISIQWDEIIAWKRTRERERKGAKEQTNPPPFHILSFPLCSILRGQRSPWGDQCDQTQEYCFKKQETWEASCNRNPFGSKGRRESWRNSTDPPSWLPKQSGILQEPFGYDQSTGLALSPISPLKQD